MLFGCPSRRPEHFYTCDSPKLNVSADQNRDVGYCKQVKQTLCPRCTELYTFTTLLLLWVGQFGGVNYEDVTNTSVYCTVVNGVDCYGNKTFIKYNVPCLR